MSDYLNNLPETWKVCRVKDLFYISKELSKKDNPVVLSLARSGIKIRDISNNEGQLAASYDNYNSVKVGDLLLNPMDLYSGANCNVSEVEGVISPAYINLRAKTKLVPKFYDYYFKVQYWTMNLFSYGKGVSYDNRWTLNSNTLLNYNVPVLPYDEQNKIVKCINSKIFQIDKLISNQEEQISKLKEYRQALISKVIKLGMDFNVISKKCDINWIGNINENYKIIRLKFLLNSPMLYGANETGGKYEFESSRYIRITDIDANGNLKDSDDNQYLSKEKSKDFILKNGDILFARSGATVGKTFLYRYEDKPCSFAGYLIKAECNQKLLMPEFLILFTQSSLYETWKSMIFIQSTIQNIGAQKYCNMEIVVPSIKNQIKIIEFLYRKCFYIDKIIERKELKKEKLQEYKKSFIYECFF